MTPSELNMVYRIKRFMFKIKVDRNDNQDDANTLCLDEDNQDDVYTWVMGIDDDNQDDVYIYV